MSNTASLSLFQQSLEFITLLYAIPQFSPWLFPSGEPKPDSTVVIDPISILWHLFRLGQPLLIVVGLYDEGLRFPVFGDIEPKGEYTNSSKKAVYHFLVTCKEQLKIPEEDLFNISELYKDDTDGFVKVSRTVALVIEKIQSVGRFPRKKSLPFHLLNNSQNNPQGDTRSKIIQEMLDTERVYIKSLEELKTYSRELDINNIIEKPKLHILFLNLDQILDFQRRFLIAMETTLSLPPQDQRIGLLFSQNEMYFQVYEAFCSNHTAATSCALEEVQNLQKLAHLIEPRALQGYFIKPIQRLCKYPLLLGELIKYTKAEEYAYMEELVMGQEASKRITARINEQTRLEDNKLIKSNLKDRVDDWKGLLFEEFGSLLLNGSFPLAPTDGEKDYHLFLFQKMLLCCKESTSKKKKRKGKEDLSVYRIKGNIYINTVTGVSDISNVAMQSFGLKVFWVNRTEGEIFVLKCKNSEQVTLWKDRIDKLVHSRRQSVIETSSRASLHSGFMNLSDESDMDKSKHNSASSTPRMRATMSGASQDSLVGAGRKSVQSLNRGESYDSDMDSAFERLRSTADSLVHIPVRQQSASTLQLQERERAQSEVLSRGGSTEAFRSSLEYVRRQSRDLPATANQSPQFGRRGLETYSPPKVYQDINGRPGSGSSGNAPVSPPPGRSMTQLISGKALPDTQEFRGDVALRRGSAENRLLAQLQKLKTGPATSTDSLDNSVEGVLDQMRMNDGNRKSLLNRPPSSVLPAPPVGATVPARTASYVVNPPILGKSRSSPPIVGLPLPPTHGLPDPPMSDNVMIPKRSTSPKPISLGGSGYSGRVGDSSVSLNSAPDYVRIKVHFLSDIFMVAAPSTSTSYSDLYLKIEKKIKLCTGMEGTEVMRELKLQYVDEGGDLVTLTGDDDMMFAFEIFQGKKEKLMNIYVT